MIYQKTNVETLIQNCNIIEKASDIIELLKWIRSNELAALIKEWKRKPHEPRFSYNTTCALMALTNYGMLTRKDRHIYNV